MNTRTRFAPSPTGYMHIGGLRTVLYAYIWAKKNAGQYILRIEDTDRTRLVPDAIDGILEVHKALDIMPDEGPHKDGGYGPYIQSERLDIYSPYLHTMCDSGHAYYCFCTSQRLDALRQEQESLKLPPRYDGHCRHIPLDEARERIASGESYTIRLKVPIGETIVFQDMIRGRIEFKTSEVDDQVLLKSDGFPTYHGAIVIDDHLMGITHVMRGEEWISSIPKQVLTARGLGIPLPFYAHLPNVLGTDGKKLSKRTGDVSVAEYFKKGYLPEALINFLVLLGWHPKQNTEILSLQEIIEKFEISDIHKSGAVLDPVKLDWMNGEYIKRLSVEDFFKKISSFLQTYQPTFYEQTFLQFSDEFHKKILSELQGRIRRLDEFIELSSFFYNDISCTPELFPNEKMRIPDEKTGIEAIAFILPFIEAADFSSIDTIKNAIIPAISQSGKKNGEILWPLRVTLSGAPFSPGAFEMAFILGKEQTLKRIHAMLAFTQ